MKAVSPKTLKPLRFGTDGWRATIGDEFTFANLERMAQAYADYLINIYIPSLHENFNSSNKTNFSSTIIVGYDGRFLSREFACRTVEILAGNNLDFRLFDEPVPTPLVSWAIHQKNAIGGVVITASHNSAEFNGFKIKSESGGSAPDKTTKAIETFIDFQSPKREIDCKSGDAEFSGNIFESYRRQISDYVDLDKIRALENRVIIDSMHGVGGYWLENFLRQGKIQTETIRAKIDPLFDGSQPEPIDRNLGALKIRVLETGAMLGIATDGDADRFGVVNEHGEVISMHDIAPFLLLYMIRQRNMTGSVVRSSSQSSLIKRIAAAHNLPLFDVPVGFKYISGLMTEKNILLGAEESGGIGVQGHLPERDGILNSLLLLEAVVALARSPSEIIREMRREFGEFHFKNYSLKLKTDIGRAIVDQLAQKPPAKIAGEAVSSIETMDGIKLIFADDSWLLFRQSGTEPLLRIYAEAASINKVQSYIEEGKMIALSNLATSDFVTS